MFRTRCYQVMYASLSLTVSMDEQTVYTTCDATGRPYQVWQQMDKSSRRRDVLLFEESNPRWALPKVGGVIQGGRYPSVFVCVVGEVSPFFRLGGPSPYS